MKSKTTPTVYQFFTKTHSGFVTHKTCDGARKKVHKVLNQKVSVVPAQLVPDDGYFCVNEGEETFE